MYRLIVDHKDPQPMKTSFLVFPPVITIFPDVKHSKTTGELHGLKISPGNIVFWYVQNVFMSSYMLHMSSFCPSLRGTAVLATIF